MIHRIQSVYLALVVLLSGILSWFVNLLPNALEHSTVLNLLSAQNFLKIVAGVFFITIAIFGIASIALYKKRLTQKKINSVNIILNIILFGLLILFSWKLSGELFSSMKGIGIWFVLGNILLLFLANRAIQKDENLVKSVDRIR
jgi:hypothetical protein